MWDDSTFSPANIHNLLVWRWLLLGWVGGCGVGHRHLHGYCVLRYVVCMSQVAAKLIVVMRHDWSITCDWATLLETHTYRLRDVICGPTEQDVLLNSITKYVVYLKAYFIISSAVIQFADSCWKSVLPAERQLSVNCILIWFTNEKITASVLILSSVTSSECHMLGPDCYRPLIEIVSSDFIYCLYLCHSVSCNDK